MTTSKEKTVLDERKRRSSKPGPKPDTLKLPGDWRDAVKKSLSKKKPVAGWPK